MSALVHHYRARTPEQIIRLDGRDVLRQPRIGRLFYIISRSFEGMMMKRHEYENLV